MKFKKQVCVIVDAFSTGKYLAPAFIDYNCIHVQSSENIPAKLANTLRKTDFIKNIIFTGDIHAVLKQLADYQVKLCIPGSESGVMLADTLSDAFKLPSNGIDYSQARRNKYLMTNVVAKAGLKTVKHIQADNENEILCWTERLEKEDFPVVLKPIDSASSDNVHFCATKEEIVIAFKAVIDANNLFGEKNNIVLAQSFNSGQEYIVNTVSWEGKHFVAEIWRVNKKQYTAIYDTCEVVAVNDVEYSELVNYTFKVLDALHIQYGAGTTELKYTQKNGPVLLECAARLMGAAEVAYSQEIFGYSQLSLMVEAYLNTSAFLKRFSCSQEQVTRYALAVLLISDANGVLFKELPLAKFAKQLATFYSYDMVAEKGSQINITTDMLSSPGTIYLLGKNKDALQRDYQAIRTSEKQGVYRENVKSFSFNAKKTRNSNTIFNYEINRHQFFRLRQRWGLVLTASDLLLNKTAVNPSRLTL